MDIATLDDQELLQQMMNGKEEALAVLYDRYGGLVFSIAIRIVQNRQNAEEITLDIFKQAWRSSRTYRPDKGLVRNWLAGMARNRAIDYLRRENARPETVHLAWVDPAVPGSPAARIPESAVRLRQEQERVREALNQLPEEQQEALALAYFGGFTQSEIAARLQQPLGTVKTRIRLAMEKMRYLLHDI